MLQVDVLLECTDIEIVQIESVLKAPKIGDKIDCRVCGRKSQKIIRVGKPYKSEHIEVKQENGQTSILNK